MRKIDMRTETFKYFTDEEHQTIYDWFLPLWGLIADTEHTQKVKRWVSPMSATNFSRDKLVDIYGTFLVLENAVLSEANVEFWEKTGIAHAEGLAAMRKKEYEQIHEFNDKLELEIKEWFDK
jgi:hypothetical protein